MIELYREPGLKIYEKSHYSHGEHIIEVKQILSWYRRRNTRILDIGCSGGLHALEFAKRGYSVTGIDIEPSAIELAKKKSINRGQNAEFRVMDIEKDELSSLGKFDFIYSLGNVLSHVSKEHLPGILWKIRECITDGGILLFDVLIRSEPFQEEIYPGKNDPQIIWKRRIDSSTGRIIMDGTFLEYGFTQHFDVWGYTVGEVTGMLASAGFGDIKYSEKLDFAAKNKIKDPVSLYFRSSAGGDV